MGFKYSQSEASDFNSNLKKEGVYECLISKIQEKTTNNGAKGLSVYLVIRNDVEQEYKNGFLFYTLWRRKEPTQQDMQVCGYGFGQVMALGKAAGLPDGKDYETLADFCNDLIKRPVRVTLKHREWNGKLQEDVTKLDTTKFPDVKHKFKPTNNQPDAYAPKASTAYAGQIQQETAVNKNSYSSYSNNNASDISDEDLPF